MESLPTVYKQCVLKVTIYPVNTVDYPRFAA